jgi:hypothetical protein
MALLPNKLQQVLAALQEKLGGKTEDAYRERDEADSRNKPEARAYAAGEAHAYGQAAEAVRDAQTEADK